MTFVSTTRHQPSLRVAFLKQLPSSSDRLWHVSPASFEFALSSASPQPPIRPLIGPPPRPDPGLQTADPPPRSRLSDIRFRRRRGGGLLSHPRKCSKPLRFQRFGSFRRGIMSPLKKGAARTLPAGRRDRRPGPGIRRQVALFRPSAGSGATLASEPGLPDGAGRMHFQLHSVSSGGSPLMRSTSSST